MPKNYLSSLHNGCIICFETNQNMLEVEFYDEIMINRGEWFDGHYVHNGEKFFKFRPVYKHKDLDIKLLYKAGKWRGFCTIDTRRFTLYSGDKFIEHTDPTYAQGVTLVYETQKPVKKYFPTELTRYSYKLYTDNLNKNVKIVTPDILNQIIHTFIENKLQEWQIYAKICLLVFRIVVNLYFTYNAVFSMKRDPKQDYNLSKHFLYYIEFSVSWFSFVMFMGTVFRIVVTGDLVCKVSRGDCLLVVYYLDICSGFSVLQFLPELLNLWRSRNYLNAYQSTTILIRDKCAHINYSIKKQIPFYHNLCSQNNVSIFFIILFCSIPYLLVVLVQILIYFLIFILPSLATAIIFIFSPILIPLSIILKLKQMSFVIDTYYLSWDYTEFFVFIGFINQLGSVTKTEKIESNLVGYTFFKQNQGWEALRHEVFLELSRRCTSTLQFFVIIINLSAVNVLDLYREIKGE